MADIFVGVDLSTEGPANGANPVLELRDPIPAQIPFSVLGLQQQGPLVNNFPVSWATVVSAAESALDYRDDFYNRIRYLPERIDLGALVSGQTRDLVIWNQHPDARVLTSLTLINGDGIEFTGPTSFTLAHNGFQTYTITVSADGPPTVNAQLAFDWVAPTEDNSVAIIGSRVVPFPFLYGQGAVETLKWQTQVITSNDGSEQRIRVRNHPRQGFAVTAFIPRPLLAFADNLLYGWRSNLWGIPVFAECRTLNTATTIGLSTVDVNTDFAQFVVGELAIIYNTATDFEIIQIFSFTANEIVTKSPLTKAFNTNAVVTPMLSCRMLGNPIRQTTGFGAFITADFEAIKNSSLPSIASPIQFLGDDVFLDEQLAIENGVSDTYTSRVDTLDFASSNVAIFAPWDNTKKSRVFGQQLTSQEELWNFRLFLHRRAGRLRPVWMPTHEVDFTFQSVGTVNTTLLVRDDGQVLYSSARTHIRILTKTGDVLATINSMVTDGSTITMVIDVDLNRDASELLHGQHLGLQRLSSDRIELSHGSNFDSDVSVPIIELKP
ncbi:MAG: hypothetical protein JKX78_03815 [Alteromonadaceae bacterium]|nr:hypothetical protein [Alteromonadaceae bacterium]MBL4909080.1 hypothetical protein [Alteromonadaceae bacterium]MBL4909146.1 hypothetical protein [Alteromonadaceae bacterium]